MARPTKKGLAYFSTDTDRYQDIKIKRLRKELSCAGIAVWDYILNEIYRVEGSFISWDEHTAFDVADYFNIKESLVNEVVNYCCNVGLFNKELRTSESVLTSEAIQERYVKICKEARRSEVNLPEQYDLISYYRKKPELLQEETLIIPEESTSNDTISTQSKVKKSKVKNRTNTNTRKKFSFDKSLIEYGFDKKLVAEWMIIRKSKKAVNSELAFKNFIREVEKVNMSKDDLMYIIAVKKQWRGFEAKWLEKEDNLQKQKSEDTDRLEWLANYAENAFNN